MSDDDSATEPRKSTIYILGQIDGKLAGLVDTLAEIKGSLTSQDKRIDTNSERITAVEHRVGSSEEWQRGHDSLEKTRDQARTETAKSILARHYTRSDMLLMGSVVAIVGEIVTHLGDMLAYLGEHLH